MDYPEARKRAAKAYYQRNRESIIKKNGLYALKRIELPLHRRDYRAFIRMLAGKARLRKKREFDLTYEYLYSIWDQQNGLCALTSRPLLLEATHYESGSLDRIDSTIGYVEGNVRFVSSIINRMKQELSDQDFLHLCELITNNRMKTTY